MRDVTYSIERCADDFGGNASDPGAFCYFQHAGWMTTTLTITLDQPDSEFLSYLTLAILPEDYTDQATAPVGTGPFKFVSRTAQDSIVLERFDGYWGTPAQLDKVTFRIIENADSLVMSLQSGAIDMFAHLTSTQAAQLGDDFQVLEGTMNLVQALYLNNAAEPFNNEKVRQALCYAVDKQQIIDVAFDGYGSPIGSSMYPAFQKYFVEDLTDYYPYDPERARELLAEAGYPDGFSMTITVPSNYQPHIDTATGAGGAAEGRGHHRGDSACGVGCLAQRGVRKPAVPVHRGRRRRLQHDCPGAAGAVHLCGGRQLYQLSEHGL